MSWLKNFFETGKIATVETEVEVSKESVINTAIAIVLVAVIVILVVRISAPKKVIK